MPRVAVKNKKGETTLDIAIKVGHERLIKLLSDITGGKKKIRQPKNQSRKEKALSSFL